MSLKYEPALDGLRAIAVLAVVSYHSHAPFAQGGQHGVDLFFVLSGFLITSILAGRSLTPVAFWRRRALRLVPALLAMVVVMLAAASLFSERYADTLWRDAFLASTYTLNVAEAGRFWDNPFLHTWSLAAEMQFYLVWPLVLPWLAKRRPALVMLALWATLTGLHYALDAFTSWEPYYFPHMSGLAMGAAVAFMPPANRWFGLVGLLLVSGSMLFLQAPIPVAEVGAALLISSLRQPSALGGLLEWPPLVRLGVLSYGVYLWHYPLTRLLKPFDLPWYADLAISAPAATLLAWISYKTVEAAFRSPRRRLSEAPVTP